MSVILLATEKPFAADAVNKIRNVVAESTHTLQLLESYTDKQQLLDAVAQADALIVRSDKVDADVIAAGKKLQIIVRAGAGYDNIDVAAATEKNVCVMNTPGQNANAVAELVFGFMIYQSRKQFSGSSGTELRGKKLGVVGFGNIGKLVAQIGKAMGMEVCAYDKFIEAHVMQEKGIKPLATIEDVFEECHYISLHIPAVSDTKGSVDYHLLKTMRKNAMLINTARQEVVNEDDIARIMAERSDISFVSDFMPKSDKLLDESMRKRWFAPVKKMGAQTEEANVNAGIAAAKQIIRFFDSGDRTFQLN
ncbi:MAG: 3-phosphoglycerate dehydrogenase [Chitinophagales bacterium]|nr:3-phosphoglycerate dehydrogenase [Chitinophagales bacterium]